MPITETWDRVRAVLNGAAAAVPESAPPRTRQELAAARKAIEKQLVKDLAPAEKALGAAEAAEAKSRSAHDADVRRVNTIRGEIHGMRASASARMEHLARELRQSAPPEIAEFRAYLYRTQQSVANSSHSTTSTLPLPSPHDFSAAADEKRTAFAADIRRRRERFNAAIQAGYAAREELDVEGDEDVIRERIAALVEEVEAAEAAL